MNDDDVWVNDPTGHLPGSPGKLAIMRARAAAKQPLFVKGDYTFEDGAAPVFIEDDGEDD